MKKLLPLLFLLVVSPVPVPAQADEIPESVRETPVVRAVRLVRDSVVSIETETRVRVLWGWTTKPGSGSGVIIDPEGLVVTNYHVVAGLEGDPNAVIKVKTAGREEHYRARITTYSDKKDIAVLRIEGRGDRKFKAIRRGHSNDLMIGETVIAIGNPFRQSHTVTVGVLSATGRSVTLSEPNTGKVFVFEDLLQTDAAINPGNSGGALIDLTGKLIGINNAIRRDSEGIGYAIPVDTVNSVLERLLDIDKGGNYWLGTETRFRDGRLEVVQVVAGGPGDRSGLKAGDRILKVGDREVRTKKDYNLGFLSTVQDMKVPFTVQRGGDRFRMVVRAGSSVDKYLYQRAGLEARTEKLSRQALNLIANVAGVRLVRPTGVMVTRVYAGGAAAKAGLEPRDFLVAYTTNHPYFGEQEVQLYHLAQMLKLIDQVEESGHFKFMIFRGGELFRGKLEVR